MSYRPTYVKGDWLAICDCCGRTFKASQLRKQWDGAMVCLKDWEPRQPQDFVRNVTNTQTLPWSRPKQTENWVSGSEIIPPSLAYTGAVAGLAVTGYAICGTS